MPTPQNVQAFLDQINASGRDFVARNPTAPPSARVTWGYDEAKGALYHVDGTGKRVYENVPGVASPSTPQGGGLVHGNPQWNQSTGQFDVPLDWGKVMDFGVGAAIAAPAVIGAFGAAPAAGAVLGPPESLATGSAAGAAGAAGASGAAGAAGATGGGGAAVAGLKARDWLDTALFGAKTIGDLAAAGKAAAATDRAAEIQDKFNRDALQFLKDQYNQERADYAPYREAGSSAVTQAVKSLGTPNAPPTSVLRGITPTNVRMGAFGTPPSTPSPTGQPNPTTQTTPSGYTLPGANVLPFQAPGVPAPAPAPQPISAFGATPQIAPAAPAAAGPTGMVTMVSPDGTTTKQVPADQAAHYEALGARRVA